MEWLVQNLPLVTAGLILLIAAVAMRRAVSWCLRMAGRTGVGLAVLALLSQVGGALGVSLGVNLFNAAVLGLLGMPGFGLLLMMNWVLAG